MELIESKIQEEFPLDLIDIDDETYQSRFDYDPKKVDNLAKDIERFGQREPIGLKESPNREGMYQILYGFQRVRAIMLLGRNSLKAQIYSAISERDCWELSVRDNEMHGDLSLVERALQCQRLKGEDWTIEELCEAYNTKKSTIYNWLKVADLDKITLGLIHHGYISVYHGLELAKIDFSRRLETLRMVVGWDLSVRDLKAKLKGKGIMIDLGLNGWISNCLKDLRWKTIEDCMECEYCEGIIGEDYQKRVRCGYSLSQQPSSILQFLQETVLKRKG